MAASGSAAPGTAPGVGRVPGEGQAAVDVPGGQGPAVAAAEAGDLGDGVVVLGGADVDAAEGGADVLGQALGERHGRLLGCGLGMAIGEGCGGGGGRAAVSPTG